MSHDLLLMNRGLIEVNFANSEKPYNKGHSEPKQFRNKASCCDFQVLLYVTLYVTQELQKF